MREGVIVPGTAGLEELIRDHVVTVDHLRALVLLHAGADHEWDAAEVAVRLYVTPEVAAGVLDGLAASGLLARGEDRATYRYGPLTERLANAVGQLVELDRTQPVTLIRMIYARSRSIDAFADAFKLRKDKGGS